jgi:hypothetical protein
VLVRAITRPADATSFCENPFFPKPPQQPVPFCRGRSDSELIDCTGKNFSTRQILARRKARSFIAQVLLKPGGCRFIDSLNRLSQFCLLPKTRNRFLNLNSNSSPEIAHHFREGSSRDPGQKREDISPGPAAETVKNLSGRTDRERRSLFKVEGTQSLEILSSLAQ